MKHYSNTFFDFKKIDPNALKILNKLHQAGHTAYLVGGSVRDLLAGIDPKDFDIVTDAEPQEIKKLFKPCYLIGKRFRLAHVHFGKKVYEVATFRKGTIDSHALILEDNEFGNAEDDATRRDFTINALFFDAKKNEIIDYVGGIEDIKKRQIQTIGSAHARFRQDPVRMVRCLKFQAKLGFEIEKQTQTALVDCLPFIVQSSNARLLEEFLRILESSFSATFFRQSLKFKLLHQLFPTLSIFYESQNQPFHLLDLKDDLVSQNELFPRAMLFSLFVFQHFKAFILTEYEGKKEPHLGQIGACARDYLNSFGAHFIHIPKKLKATASFILTNQFRFTPLGEYKKFRLKFFKSKEFLNALLLLRIRGLDDLGAQKAYTFFMNKYTHARKNQE